MRRLAARAREDRGSVTAEHVIVVPLLFTLILLITQAVVWGHALHVAQATAAHTLAATRVEGGTESAGHAEAQHVLTELGDGPLRDVRVGVERGADEASVRVEGTASSVVPFLRLPVRAEAAGRVEKFRPAGQVTP
ncbi:pilus assembly protein TadE [Streptomyces armeniacus]|uniref:Pilus assembly protein TadE n=1 Tax=Streptomyces armeniacus TaxID=83291 RepID=A0A345Y1F4_9ACTN|nr:pilus assembly protein TadE [Streptomyces armeniacus]